MAIIYKITNTTNNKAYIGATIHSLEDRWGRHLSAAFNDDSQMAIHKALRKYGKEVFKIEVVEEHSDTNYVFDVLEPRYITEQKTYGNDGYNMTRGGDGWYGMKHSPESILKMRNAKLGKKDSEETRQKKSDALRGKPGRTKGKHYHSMSEARKGIKMKEEHRLANIERLKGRKQPVAQKEKVRDAISEKHKLQILSSGEIIEVLNLRQFCKDHNLSQGSLKTFGHTKGYKMIETTKKVREYTIKHLSTGEVFKTNNLKKFCEDLGFDNSRLYKSSTSLYEVVHNGYTLVDTTITEVVHRY